MQMKLVHTRKRIQFSVFELVKVFFTLLLCSSGNSNNISGTISSQKSLVDIDPKQVRNETFTKSAKLRLPLTKEEIEEFKMERSRRMKQQRERAREKMKAMIENPQLYTNPKTELMTEENVNSFRDEIIKKDPNLENEDHRWLRSIYNNKNTYNPYDLNNLADPSKDYDGWAQGFRMLGAFISCDNGVEGYNNGYNNGEEQEQGCSRYIMWAAYIDPNYRGYGRNEYFGFSNNRNKNGNSYYGNGCQRGDDGSYHCYTSNVNNNYNQNSESNEAYTDPVGKLDCHDVDTEWKLLGVYRQEFYEFFEQITKHMWYYSDYEYIVAYAGLNFLNDGECNLGGYDYYGNEVYYAPKPLEGGSFELSLYRDWRCLIPIPSEEQTYDEYFGNNVNIEEWGDDDYNIKQNAQALTKEYTMTLFNEVFEEFKYCTLCYDYPSYQDGYFNGDYGTDEDDLINQCWKFYSHDTDHCTHECISLGHAQGTITQIKYGKKYYGIAWEGHSGDTSRRSKRKKGSGAPTSRDNSRANLFLMANAALLMCTYYVYQNAAQFRDIIFSDNNEEGGLQRNKGSKVKETLLILNNKGDSRETHATKTKPPWLNKWKQTNSSDENNATNKMNKRQSRQREAISKNKDSNEAISFQDIQQFFHKQHITNQRSRSKGETRENLMSENVPNKELFNTYKPPNWSGENKTKVFVKDMERRNRRSHYRNRSNGGDKNEINMNRQDTRTIKATKRNIKTGKRVPPPIIIENLPSVFE